MSDNTKETTGGAPPERPAPAPEAAAAPKAVRAPAPEGPAKAVRGLPLPLLLVVAGGLAAGGATGGLLVAPRILAARTPAPARPAGHAPAAAPHGEAARPGGKHGGSAKNRVYRLDNLIVNPAGTQGTRFLMASVAFELPDEKGLEVLREHEAQIRDAVISTLERQTLEDLTRPGARERIKRELLGAAAPVTEGMSQVRVYLPQFVLQ